MNNKISVKEVYFEFELCGLEGGERGVEELEKHVQHAVRLHVQIIQ